MNDFFWLVLAVVMFGVVAHLIEMGRERRLKKETKWESDEQLLERLRRIEKAQAERGSEGTNFRVPFDLAHELAAAMARRDHRLAKTKKEKELFWAAARYYIFQLVVGGFVYLHAEDLKLVITGLFVMLWASITHNLSRLELVSEKTLSLLSMAYPDAKNKFFHSEHCYDSKTHLRAMELSDPNWPK